MKRRPNADDREIADAVLNLKPGAYKVTVGQRNPFGLAPIKTEGGMTIKTASTEIDFVPAQARQ